MASLSFATRTRTLCFRWFSITSLVAASMTASSSWPRSLWNAWMRWYELSSRLWDFEDLYKEMIASHVKPSVATFSILIRLYAQCVSISMVYLAHRETTLPRDRRCSSIRYLKRRSLAVDSVDRLRQALGWCIGLAPPGTDQIFWSQGLLRTQHEVNHASIPFTEVWIFNLPTSKVHCPLWLTVDVRNFLLKRWPRNHGSMANWPNAVCVIGKDVAPLRQPQRNQWVWVIISLG